MRTYMKLIQAFRLAALSMLAALPFHFLTAQDTQGSSSPEDPFRSVILAWGDVVMPLKLWAEPRYFKGELTVSLEQARAMLSEPVRFYVNGRPIYFDDLRFSALQKPTSSKPVLRDSTGMFPGFPGTVDSAGIYPGSGRDGMMEQRVSFINPGELDILLGFLKPGDVFQFTTSKNRQQGIVLSGVALRVYNEFEEFTPRYYVPPPSYAPTDTVRWQQVRVPGRNKDMIRFDPSAAVAAKIRSGYSDSSRYELIPLPGFVSGEMFVDEALRVVPLQDLEGRDTLVKESVLDRYRIPEVFIRWSENWTLIWGVMEAYPKGPYVKRDTFNAESVKPLFLRRAGKDLPIVQLSLSVVPVKGAPRQYLVDGRDPAGFRDVLLAVPPRTTLYFEDLIVQDGDGEQRSVPLTFQLNVW